MDSGEKYANQSHFDMVQGNSIIQCLHSLYLVWIQTETIHIVGYLTCKVWEVIMYCINWYHILLLKRTSTLLFINNVKCRTLLLIFKLKFECKRRKRVACLNLELALNFDYQTVFYAPEGKGPVSLNLRGMGKGEAWVNGQSIGRYWSSYLSPSNSSGCSENCDYRGTYDASKCLKKCGQPAQTL